MQVPKAMMTADQFTKKTEYSFILFTKYTNKIHP